MSTNQFSIDKIVSYTAEHFEEIGFEKFKKLNFDTIEDFIKNEFLKLDEEYSLLNFILKLCEDDSKYSSLFEYLNFNNISEKSFALFIEKFSIENLNASIWRSICQRLNPTLNDANVVATFQTKDLNEFYRFIKIRQTGINWQNDYQMIFYNIDFYGKLKCH